LTPSASNFLAIVDFPNVSINLLHDKHPISNDTITEFKFLTLRPSLTIVVLKVPHSERTAVVNDSAELAPRLALEAHPQSGTLRKPKMYTPTYPKFSDGCGMTRKPQVS
jgi:hypothetical protein